MWYVVQVVGGKEETTRRLVERLVEPSICEECFTPKYEIQKKIRGEWRMRTEVLFPGYIIVVTNKIDQLKAQLRAVPEFTRLLTAGETYLPLDKRECALIDAFTRPGNRTVEMSMGVLEGEHVVVTSGPLLGREGLIRGVNRHKGLAFLEIEMFGRTKQIKVGLGIVAKRKETEQ